MIIFYMIVLFFVVGIYLEIREAIEYRDYFKLFGYGLFSLVVVSFIAYTSYNNYYKNSIISKFDNHISSYLSMPIKYNNYPFSKSPSSKIIIINKNFKQVSGLHFDLLENRKALVPSDVDIIVWLDYKQEYYANYQRKRKKYKTKRTIEDGTDGYIEYCNVTVIDQNSNSIISSKLFSGIPKDEISYSSRRGSKPPKKRVFQVSNASILNYVTSF